MEMITLPVASSSPLVAASYSDASYFGKQLKVGFRKHKASQNGSCTKQIFLAERRLVVTVCT